MRNAFSIILVSGIILVAACSGHQGTVPSAPVGLATSAPAGTLSSSERLPQSNKQFFDAKSILSRRDVQDLGPAPSSYAINLEFVLPEQNTSLLNQMLAAIHTAGSRRHSRLTHDQYIANFAPSPSTYAAAVAKLTAYGFQVLGTDPNRQIIKVQTSIGVADHVLGLASHLVRQNGKLRHLQTLDESLPSDLASSVAFVVGTSDVVTAITARCPGSPGCILPTPTPTPAPTPPPTPTPSPSPCSGLNGPIYDPIGDVGPPGIANSYQLPAQAGYCGAGHALGFMIDEDPSQSDLAAYLAYFQITQTGSFVRRAVDGGGAAFSGNPNDGSALEANLDYQTEVGLAPDATVYEYSIPDLGWQSQYDAMVAVVDDDVLDAMSISLAGCEQSAPSSILGAMNQILHQADLEGITFSAATGDNGLFYCSGTSGQGINAPASLPDITAVGGTEPGAYGGSAPFTNQTAWGNGGGGALGSGGGYSAIWSTPPYQQYLPFLPSRSIPDISLAATYAPEIFNGSWKSLEGTSFASPIFAAFQTTWNQEANFHRGFANVAMYSANQSYFYTADCLNDITVGNNGSQSAVGWDYVTGLGSLYGGCSF